MIKEFAVKFECRVKETRRLGNQGGAGMVCFAEVVCMHVDQKVLDEHKNIDPRKLEPVARLGGNHYIKVSEANLFTMPKPNKQLAMGFDYLPPNVLTGRILTANQLGQLASVEKIPVIDVYFSHIGMQYLLEDEVSEKRIGELHKIAGKMLDLELLEEAWQVLLRDTVVIEPMPGLVLVARVD